VVYIVAIVPLLFRMMQCFNQARQSSGKFLGHIQMFNFGKYLASVLTATLSFLTTQFPSLLPFFIASSVISTSYSYYWDLVSHVLYRNMIGDFWRRDQNINFSETNCATRHQRYTILLYW
jgi:hypothetical protein